MVVPSSQPADFRRQRMLGGIFFAVVLEPLLILFQQAQGGAAEPGEVFLGAALTNSGIVLAEAHVEGPVQAVFDPQCCRTQVAIRAPRTGFRLLR